MSRQTTHRVNEEVDYLTGAGYSVRCRIAEVREDGFLQIEISENVGVFQVGQLSLVPAGVVRSTRLRAR